MKIRLKYPTHRLSIDLIGFTHRIGLQEMIYKAPYPPTDKLIVIANGSPDNRVMLLLLHQVNETNLVDMVFPEHKGLAIAQYLHEYVKQGYKKILVVLDQEEHPINKLHEHFKRKILGLRNYNVSTDLENRLAIAEVSNHQEAHAIIVISGVEDERFIKHTVEDHLLKLAEQLNIYNISNNVDPKEEWNKLDKNTQLKIFKAMHEHKDLAKEVFRQYIAGLKIIL